MSFTVPSLKVAIKWKLSVNITSSSSGVIPSHFNNDLTFILIAAFFFSEFIEFHFLFLFRMWLYVAKKIAFQL